MNQYGEHQMYWFLRRVGWASLTEAQHQQFIQSLLRMVSQASSYFNVPLQPVQFNISVSPLTYGATTTVLHAYGGAFCVPSVNWKVISDDLVVGQYGNDFYIRRGQSIDIVAISITLHLEKRNVTTP